MEKTTVSRVVQKQDQILVLDNYSYCVGIAHDFTIVNILSSHLHAGLVDPNIFCPTCPKHDTFEFLTDVRNLFARRNASFIGNHPQDDDNVSVFSSVSQRSGTPSVSSIFSTGSHIITLEEINRPRIYREMDYSSDSTVEPNSMPLDNQILTNVTKQLTPSVATFTKLLFFIKNLTQLI